MNPILAFIITILGSVAVLVSAVDLLAYATTTPERTSGNTGGGDVFDDEEMAAHWREHWTGLRKLARTRVPCLLVGPPVAAVGFTVIFT